MVVVVVMQLFMLLLLLLSLRYKHATPPEIPELFMHPLPIAELRSFSDSTSNLLLLVPYAATVSVSNLAIAVAAAFRKSLSVSIYETC